MKRLLLLLCIGSTFASCTSYRYMKVNAPDMARTEQNGFITEKDSLQISYNFFGSNGPVQMEIHNKTDKAVMLDMNRSALVVNNKATTFHSGDISLNGTSSGSSLDLTRNWSVERGSFSATGTQQPNALFIPARSFVTFTPLNLTNEFTDTIPKSRFQKTSLAFATGGTAPAVYANFSQDQSPMVFSTYLTFVTSDMERKEYTLRHNFYVAEVIKTSFRPDNLEYSSLYNGDKFYISRTRGAGAATVIALTGLAAGTAAITNNNKPAK
jgi:hypothetical protein